MNSFEDVRRQLRIALFVILIIIPSGVIGFMMFEKISLIDAIWLTMITLTTVGYGDIFAITPTGRFFTIILLIVGLGSVALAAQAAVQFFVSPVVREISLRRKAERKIDKLRDHYIICGEGELVDKTINSLLKRVELRRVQERENLARPITTFFDRFINREKRGLIERLFLKVEKQLINLLVYRHRGDTILDAVVVVTRNEEFANHLREQGLLVIEDDPTDDRALRRAGISHAKALMSMLDSDTETLLNVLTARSRNSDIYITASTREDLSIKIIRVGANNVLPAYEVAGQFLNNATLRPAVNDYFNSILFDQRASYQIVQLYVWENSPWLGKSLTQLDLPKRFDTGIIGIRQGDGNFRYAPKPDHIIEEDEVLLAVTPGSQIAAIQQDCRGDTTFAAPPTPNWQRLPGNHIIQSSKHACSLLEAEADILEMSQHYIICGDGPIIRSSLDKLNPERPFVVVTDDHTLAADMLKRGFRVVMGDPSEDETLKRAGVSRALAIMISIEDQACSVLTILNCRTLNRHLLIVVTAITDDMIPKLRRAGADRVVSPFRIAAQFMLLATTRPVVSDFMQYVIFNHQAGIETTELYMQDDSPWIGKTIGELYLDRIFKAGAIGVRQKDGRFIYAPSDEYMIQPYEVLIVITPMSNADELRAAAHGSRMRPMTLRTSEVARTVSGIGQV